VHEDAVNDAPNIRRHIRAHTEAKGLSVLGRFVESIIYSESSFNEAFSLVLRSYQHYCYWKCKFNTSKCYESQTTDDPIKSSSGVIIDDGARGFGEHEAVGRNLL
jgi:hypothetical protein